MVDKKSRQRGQGVLEYILVLIVVVTIVLGLLYRFHEGVAQWMGTYMAYYQCLLETGELPGNTQECALANIQAALPDLDGFGGGGGGGTGGQGDRDLSQQGDSDSTDETESSDSDTGQASQVGGRGGRRGGRGGSGRNVRDRATEQETQAATKSKKSYTGSDEALNFGANIDFAEDTRKGGRKRKTVLTGYSIRGEEDKKDKTLGKSFSKSAKTAGSNLRKRKVAVNQKPEIQKIKTDDAGFSIGAFLRTLIIIGIIIAILVFAGGQALQIAKNWE